MKLGKCFTLQIIKLLKQILLSNFLSYYCLHTTKNIAYHITVVLIFYVNKLMVMGNSTNLHAFNFAILLKSRKFDAHKL